MPVPLSTVKQLRTKFPSSSWALSSEEFQAEACLEEDPERLVAFVESHCDRLTPEVIFVSLNPSSEHPTDYMNFHSPSWKHYDERLKEFL